MPPFLAPPCSQPHAPDGRLGACRALTVACATCAERRQRFACSSRMRPLVLLQVLVAIGAAAPMCGESKKACTALDLLSPSLLLRVMPLVIYAESILREGGSEWGTLCYNHAADSGTAGQFDVLIRSVKLHGIPRLSTSPYRTASDTQLVAAAVAADPELPMPGWSIERVARSSSEEPMAPDSIASLPASDQWLKDAFLLRYLELKAQRMVNGTHHMMVLYPVPGNATWRWERARTMLSEYNYTLVASRVLNLDLASAAVFVQHLYEQVPSMDAKKCHRKATWCGFVDRKLRQARLVFFESPTPIALVHVLEMKNRLRSEYGYEKNSVHASDSHVELLSPARLALNRNSLTLLSQHALRSPQSGQLSSEADERRVYYVHNKRYRMKATSQASGTFPAVYGHPVAIPKTIATAGMSKSVALWERALAGTRCRITSTSVAAQGTAMDSEDRTWAVDVDSSNGSSSRLSIVGTPAEFVTAYMRMPPAERHASEVVDEQRGCFAFFDLDTAVDSTEKLQQAAAAACLVQKEATAVLVEMAAQREPGKSALQLDVLVLDATRLPEAGHMGKFSRHLVCRATRNGTAWLLRGPDNAATVAKLVRQRLLASGQDAAARLVDLHAYGKHKSFRLVGSSKLDSRARPLEIVGGGPPLDEAAVLASLVAPALSTPLAITTGAMQAGNCSFKLPSATKAESTSARRLKPSEQSTQKETTKAMKAPMERQRLESKAKLPSELPTVQLAQWSRFDIYVKAAYARVLMRHNLSRSGTIQVLRCGGKAGVPSTFYPKGHADQTCMLLREPGSSRCSRDVTFGCTHHGVWVKAGCEGHFSFLGEEIECDHAKLCRARDGARCICPMREPCTAEDPIDFMETAYFLHEVSFGMHEPCFKGTLGRSHTNCTIKRSFDDYVRTFRNLITSMRSEGFNAAYGRVPICLPKPWAPLLTVNAAHRVGVALGLGLPTLPIVVDDPCSLDRTYARPEDVPGQPKNTKWWRRSFDYHKFSGMQTYMPGTPSSLDVSRHYDVVVSDIIAADPNMHVLHLWPHAVSMGHEKMVEARQIVAEHCAADGGITYGKLVPMSSVALRSYMRQTHTKLYDSFWTPYHDPIIHNETAYIMVVRSTADMLARCQGLVRDLYHLPGDLYEASFDFTATHADAMLASRLLLSEMCSRCRYDSHTYGIVW